MGSEIEVGQNQKLSDLPDCWVSDAPVVTEKNGVKIEII